MAIRGYRVERHAKRGQEQHLGAFLASLLFCFVFSVLF